MINAIELLLSLFVALSMVMPRMLVCFTIFSIFPRTIVPIRIKVALMITWSCFLVPVVLPTLEATPPLSLWTLMLMGKEALLGVLLGLLFAPILWTFQAVGELIDIQTGASTGTLFDPITNTQAGPFSLLMRNLATAYLFSTGAFLGMLGLLFKSYALWPVMSAFPQLPQPMGPWIMQFTGQLLVHLATFAAPFLAVLLVLEMGLGLIGRSLPSMNIFMLSMPLKFWTALGLCVLSMPLMLDHAAHDLLPGRHTLEALGRLLGLQ